MWIIKRKAILIGTLILSLTLCYEVNSYTTAKVDNNATLSIVTSENGLIAVPNDVILNIEKHITNTKIQTINDEVELDVPNVDSEIESKIETNLAQNNFCITNNMQDTIDVRVFHDNRFNTSENQSLSVINNSIIIRPGESQQVLFNIDDNVNSETANFIISAKWNGGLAEIEKSIKVEVESSVTENEVINDLRTKSDMDADIIENDEQTTEDIKAGEEIQILKNNESSLQEDMGNVNNNDVN